MGLEVIGQDQQNSSGEPCYQQGLILVTIGAHCLHHLLLLFVAKLGVTCLKAEQPLNPCPLVIHRAWVSELDLLTLSEPEQRRILGLAPAPLF